MLFAAGPIKLARRSRISAAALFVNVIARIWLGHALRLAKIHAILRVRTRVLPLPAPAPIKSAGPVYWTALDCWGFKPSNSV